MAPNGAMPVVWYSASTAQPGHSSWNPMSDYIAISQNIFLILSNFSLVPTIYQAWKGQYFGESITYIITMFASSFYHLCDNERISYCIARYKTLQFLDFFSAILALWCTAIILAPIPARYISALHLTGALFFAALLFSTSVTGFWSFAIPAACSVTLLLIVWVRRFWLKRRWPELVYTWHFYVALALSLVGGFLFAIQMAPKLEHFYGYTHSAWHVCMAVAIVFLLPRRNLRQFVPVEEIVSERVENLDDLKEETVVPIIQQRYSRKISDIFCFDNVRLARPPSVERSTINEISARQLLNSAQSIPENVTIILPAPPVCCDRRALPAARTTSLMVFDEYPSHDSSHNASLRRHESLRSTIV